MPNTPNYNLYYPSSFDRPAAFPAAQKTSQETLDTLLKQISDSIPAGNTSTLNSAKDYTDQKSTATLTGARDYTDQKIAAIAPRDSGSRNINALNPVITGGTLIIMRVDSLVQINCIGLQFAGANGGAVTLDTALPTGWRPANTFKDNTIEMSGQDAKHVLISWQGVFRFYDVSASDTIDAVFSYITRDPWQNTDLGTPN